MLKFRGKYENILKNACKYQFFFVSLQYKKGEN